MSTSLPSSKTSVVVTVLVLAAAMLTVSCGCKPPTAASAADAPAPSVTPAPSPSPVGGGEPVGPAEPAARTALLTPGSTNYDRLEGTSFQNACGADSDCQASGCSSEVCAAEEVVSTCDVVVAKPQGNCGCVEGLCLWYHGGAAAVD